MSHHKLSRRLFLTGLGGTVVALPLLETMLDKHGEVFAQDGMPIPKRYITCFGGHSLGADNTNVHNMYVPDTVGANYDTKLALEPLSEQGIKDDVSVISNLHIPWDDTAGSRHIGFHLASLSPLISGVRSLADGRTVRGKSSDQVVADMIAGDTTFKSLVYRVQASWYLDQSAPYGRDLISYRGDGDGIEATVSPQQAFRSLFSNFTPPDPGDAARRDFLLRSRKSVLDIVRGSYDRLAPQLSGADKIRIQEHLQQIRELELRVGALAPQETASCRALDDPGADPIIGANNPSSGGDGFVDTAGYSDEDIRARLLIDMIHMAMVCDLTRVASLQFTMAQSHMNMYPLLNIPFDLHEIGHSSPLRTEGVSRVINWHMGHWAYLVKKFKDTQEFNGTMLDNSAIIYMNEGGHGWDPEGGKDDSAHSTERMAMLVAGRAGGLSPGRHIVSNQAHPAKVLVSAMNAVGVVGDTLGEVQGNVPELFA